MTPMFRSVAIVLLAACATAPALGQEPAATVVLATGRAEAGAAGAAPRPLRQGNTIYPGEQVTTFAHSYVNLRFTDESRILLRPDTQFAISEYRFPKVAAGADLKQQEREVATGGRTLLSLVKGGFRALTGLIGSANRDNFRVQTSVATIGIRGTDFVAFVCEPGLCDGVTADGNLMPAAGVTVGVESGGVFLETAQGRFEVPAGQFGFVGTDGAFFILAQPPGVLGANPVPDPEDCD